jgi:hypothetical protein
LYAISGDEELMHWRSRSRVLFGVVTTSNTDAPMRCPCQGNDQRREDENHVRHYTTGGLIK